jgi:CubicO group peptidase (beta-lactamase class C family)
MEHGQLLPRSTAEGLAAGGVAALLDRLDERAIECHSLMVVRHGRVVAEGWWAPFSADRPHLLYSLTKSFTAVAVGIAIGDGLLSLDSRMPEAPQLTVEHLLTMTTGHRTDSLAEAWTLEPTDLVKGFLRVPFDDPAGTRHAYDNPASFVLARMVERVTGQGLPEFLDERLFRPMGIEGTEWDRVGSGASFGFHGLHLTTEAVAAFGELLLRGGLWRGRQLVPRDWLERATTRRIDTLQFEDGSRTADWLQGYGYHFWMSRHGYRGDGAFGQFCLVLPEHDLVVALTAATTDMQGLLDAVWDCLLPAIGTAGNSLAGRLRQLSLPMPENDRPTAGGWRLRLLIEQTTLDIEVGDGEWRESSPLGRPVVAAGGWQAGTFVADLYVITGPHRIRLVVDGSAVSATWNLVPLTGPSLLRQLRAPLMTRPDVS